MGEVQKTLFISDVHLEASDRKTSQTFLTFMHAIQAKAKHIDCLYILGDLFDAWIGDDETNAFNQMIIGSIHALKKNNITTYFIHGNRDFLLGRQFSQCSSCIMLPDIKIAALYGQKVLLMHGDLLCTHDQVYQRSRKILRNKLLQWAYLKTSLNFRHNIAMQLRNKSKQHTERTASEIMDVTPSVVIDYLMRYQVNSLIHGHTHKPNIHKLKMSANQSAERIVLGSWHQKGNVLVWDEQGQKNLIDFSEDDDFKFLD